MATVWAQGVYATVAQSGVLNDVRRAFWGYTDMILRPDEHRALDEACRKAGLQLPGRLPFAKDAGSEEICALIEAGARLQGRTFVHHAGFQCGRAAARPFSTAVRDPNGAALRLAGALSAACPGVDLVATSGGPDRLEVALANTGGVAAPLVAFAGGFLKGAAGLLNEGVVPRITESVDRHAKVWTAVVHWAEAAPAGRLRATGGSRTRHR